MELYSKLLKFNLVVKLEAGDADLGKLKYLNLEN